MASTHKSFTQHFKNRMTKDNTCKTVKEFFEKSLTYLKTLNREYSKPVFLYLSKTHFLECDGQGIRYYGKYIFSAYGLKYEISHFDETSKNHEDFFINWDTDYITINKMIKKLEPLLEEHNIKTTLCYDICHINHPKHPNNPKNKKN
jgi:hypothetical protein